MNSSPSPFKDLFMVFDYVIDECIQEKYEAFKQRVQRKWRTELEKDAKRSPQNHAALIQVIYLFFDTDK